MTREPVDPPAGSEEETAADVGVAAADVCACGRPVRQPWKTRDALWSPASFVGGVIWLALGVASVVGGWTVFGWSLPGVLVVLVVGALIQQTMRGHRGSCVLRRAMWFGLAVSGLPLRVAYWFNL